MSLRVCLECRTAYAADLPACPHCGTASRDAVYDWDDDIVKDVQPQPKASRKTRKDG
jgi:RNA polymerase subunit RPABC4/transcription elongation factor Spt4